jgi:hypothetical protein
MAVPESTLNRTQIRKVNAWTAEQFRKKNVSLSKNPSGIHLIDRCPLDPLTFGKPGERTQKATRLHKAITNDGQNQIEKGHVIYLEADARDLKFRTSYKHKYWTEAEFDGLLREIGIVYKKIPKTVLCTRGRSVYDVIRELAKIIFIDEYEEVDVGFALKEFANLNGHPGGKS